MTPERRTLIESIRTLPDALESAVRGLTDPELDTPYRKGGWTVRQVVHHLADSHLNAFVRMKLILTEDHPTLKPYDQNRWAVLPDSLRMPVGPSLALVRGLHERWCALLESVRESEWSKTAHHPERGEVSLDGILSTYAHHGRNHVEQILGLRRRQGW